MTLIKLTHPFKYMDRVVQPGESIDVPPAMAAAVVGNEWAIKVAEVVAEMPNEIPVEAPVILPAKKVRRGKRKNSQ